jgi:hypothetical protein
MVRMEHDPVEGHGTKDLSRIKSNVNDMCDTAWISNKWLLGREKNRAHLSPYVFLTLSLEWVY